MIKDILTEISLLNQPDNGEALVLLVNFIRPKLVQNKDVAIFRLRELCKILEENEDLRKGLNKYLSGLLSPRKLTRVFSDIGIISDKGFFRETTQRLWYKLLPPHYPEESMEHLLTQVFHKSWDFGWIDHIPNEDWAKFLSLVGFTGLTTSASQSTVHSQMLYACELLVHRISEAGLDTELVRMVPEMENLHSPFVTLHGEMFRFQKKFRETGRALSPNDEHYLQVLIILNQCSDFIQKALRNRTRFGISLDITFKLLRLSQQIDRLRFLLKMLTLSRETSFLMEEISFLKKVIEYHGSSNRLRSFFSQTTRLVAYQITQHTGRTGEHYITESKKEYIDMLYSAAGGGFVIAFLSLFKLLISYADLSPFGYAFYYSLNYALGFILIYLLHFTVATKQPAMTAATLAQSIEGKGQIKFEAFTHLVTRTFRSQFIAFVGNVFAAFPVALLLGFFVTGIWGPDIIPETKAEKLLKDVHPWKSLALFHAAIAGVHLFVSGIAAGYFMNHNVHNNFSNRVKEHPGLKRLFSPSFRTKIKQFIDEKIGGLSSNFVLGVLLGSTWSVGIIFGLPIDIRHITFSTGNFALGLTGMDFQVSGLDVVLSVLCIGFIGFLNFIVSFSLSLLVAMKSRELPISQFTKLLAAVWRKFLKTPSHFFIPPGQISKSGQDKP